MRHLRGESGAGPGDSGGPVYTLRGSTSEVNAVGILSAGSILTSASCTGVPFRGCFSELIYVPIAEALRATDTWVEVQ